MLVQLLSLLIFIEFVDFSWVYFGFILGLLKKQIESLFEENMKCQIPEISWHNRDPVLSVDFQPKVEGSDKQIRLASGGTGKKLIKLLTVTGSLFIYRQCRFSCPHLVCHKR